MPPVLCTHRIAGDDHRGDSAV